MYMCAQVCATPIIAWQQGEGIAGGEDEAGKVALKNCPENWVFEMDRTLVGP